MPLYIKILRARKEISVSKLRPADQDRMVIHCFFLNKHVDLRGIFHLFNTNG